MSSVLALKRNSSTVRYCFEADAEPAVLPRALELLAKRGLVPARVFAQADADQLSVEIEVEGLAPDTADHVGRCLSQIVGVRQIFLSDLAGSAPLQWRVLVVSTPHERHWSAALPARRQSTPLTITRSAIAERRRNSAAPW